MRAELANADLHLILETNRELYQLVPYHLRPPTTTGTEGLHVDRSTLSSRLSSLTDGCLSADVTLDFAHDTRSKDGIDVEFSPPHESDWSRIKKIHVRAAYHLYDQLATNGQIVALYLGDHRVRIKFGTSSS